MEYELHPDGPGDPRCPSRTSTPEWGLERSASILQGVLSVYETDGYQAIMEWIASESGVAYGESETATKAHRVLADHGRGMTFMIADGVRPSGGVAATSCAGSFGARSSTATTSRPP